MPGSPGANRTLGGEETPESAVEIPVLERICRGLGERLQVIIKVPGHSVDGKPQKPYVRELVEVDDEAVFDCLGVRVDANRFPEDLFGLDVFLRGWKIRHE